MDEIEALQQRMLAASRLDRAPAPEVFDRMRAGVLARIAADEEEPEWHTDEAQAAPARTSRRWLYWSLGAAAAAILVATWLVPRLGHQTSTRDDDAAMFEHEDRSSHGHATPRTPPPLRHRAATPDPKPDPAPEPEPDSAPEPAPEPPSISPPHSSPSASRRAGVPGPNVAAPSPPAASATSDVAGEAKLLRTVQRALARDALNEAQAALDRYAERFPDGVLVQEAEGAAVIIACRKHTSNADARARRFLAAHEGSPLAPRIRAACATESPQ